VNERVWDATCVDTLALSHRVLASSEAGAVANEAGEAGAVANEAGNCKKLKYSHLELTHAFFPVTVETLGALGHEAQSFLREVARHIETSTGDLRSHHFLLREVVAVQWGNMPPFWGL
jgi:hypothetical protein